MADFNLNNQGTIWLLRPNTEPASDWIAEHIPDDAQWIGGAVVIEHRYVADIAQGIMQDGLTYTIY